MVANSLGRMLICNLVPSGKSIVSYVKLILIGRVAILRLAAGDSSYGTSLRSQQLQWTVAAKHKNSENHIAVIATHENTR